MLKSSTRASGLRVFRDMERDESQALRCKMLARHAHLTPERLKEWLIKFGNHSSTQKIERVEKFISFPRDIKDEKILNLAIQEKATHIVTRDKDLLSLMDSKTKDGKLFQEHFPNTKIVTPEKMKFELEQIQAQAQSHERERQRER